MGAASRGSSVGGGETEEGDEERGPVLWSLTWQGYARRRDENGDVLDEEPVGCVLKVYYAGNWVVCGHNGAVVVKDDDPVLLERLATCLMGRVVTAARVPPG